MEEQTRRVILLWMIYEHEDTQFYHSSVYVFIKLYTV